MTITLPLPHAKLSPNARVHWSTKHRLTKHHRALAAIKTIAHIANHGKPSTAPTQYRIHFYHPDHRRRDDDNAIASCKAYRDGIADALRIDDHTLHLSGVTLHTDPANPRVEFELL
jgi:crossover junction endodeoxyribonuclease RusA